MDFAFVCDYADAGGPKINALGVGFDTIFAQTVPWTQPLFFFVAQLSASVAEVGQKDLVIRLIDADGADIAEIHGSFPIAQPIAGVEAKARIAVQFAGVTFPQYGVYALHLVVGGNELHVIPLTVTSPPATA
ncbi:MAG: hypothetical protein KGK07_13370 [Chloroflexota bacterium]|nr:hypothetical protein [Chloroflexota bacterium]